ncbi:phosphatase PAP2 family protein [Cellulophaga sp. HaHaR_3_176]|uniref:phosphatase PAP2 family protein n=1 Tax=Cellulophaga sp. HaHaR_3_176 TaxID=1942464 RepID=UPI001C1F3FF9|nr:phosphatase PAP2 family protein [Cellulophaga sp. HaHaR_3_176]QWX84301.1 phosphatase PAP2 family protein [Cellulophaga sp. HaHaR_3_176]
MLEKLLTWDRETFIYLNSLGIEKYDHFWSFATNISTWIPLYVLFAYLLLTKKPNKEDWRKFATVFLMLIFVLALTGITKEWVGRLRPSIDENINTLIRIVKASNGFSFFSGHSAFSFSLTTIIVLFLKHKYKWVWVFYIWPFFLAFSRIYVGVHYPVDLITGATVGILSANLFVAIYLRFIAHDSSLSHL